MSTLEPTAHQADWWQLLLCFPGGGTTARLWFLPRWQTLAGTPAVLSARLPELWLLPLGLLTGNQPQIKGRYCLPYTCLPVVGIPTLWVYVAPLICFLLSVMEPPQQGSECCERERSLSGSSPHSWGSQTFTHWLSFPFRRNHMLFPLGAVWCWQSQCSS